MFLPENAFPGFSPHGVDDRHPHSDNPSEEMSEGVTSNETTPEKDLQDRSRQALKSSLLCDDLFAHNEDIANELATYICRELEETSFSGEDPILLINFLPPIDHPAVSRAICLVFLLFLLYFYKLHYQRTDGRHESTSWRPESACRRGIGECCWRCPHQHKGNQCGFPFSFPRSLVASSTSSVWHQPR